MWSFLASCSGFSVTYVVRRRPYLIVRGFEVFVKVGAETFHLDVAVRVLEDVVGRNVFIQNDADVFGQHFELDNDAHF